MNNEWNFCFVTSSLILG